MVLIFLSVFSLDFIPFQFVIIDKFYSLALGKKPGLFPKVWRGQVVQVLHRNAGEATDGEKSYDAGTNLGGVDSHCVEDLGFKYYQWLSWV